MVAANCARVQEALRVLEEYGRTIDPALAAEAAAIRYGLYDLEVTCLNATLGARRRNKLKDARLCLITTPCDDLTDRVEAALRNGVGMVQYRCKAGERPRTPAGGSAAQAALQPLRGAVVHQ